LWICSKFSFAKEKRKRTKKKKEYLYSFFYISELAIYVDNSETYVVYLKHMLII